MNAEEARGLTNSIRGMRSERVRIAFEGLEGEDQINLLHNFVMDFVVPSMVKEKALQGKASIRIEPFSLIPGKYHLKEIEEKVMGRVLETLHVAGYQSPAWEWVDKRVILSLSW